MDQKVKHKYLQFKTGEMVDCPVGMSTCVAAHNRL